MTDTEQTDTEQTDHVEADYPLVLIEGTRMASVDLPDGERQTVLLTESVQQRIDYGYVRVVHEIDRESLLPIEAVDPVIPDAPQPAPEIALTAESQPQAEPNTVPQPPSKSASRQDWADFVAKLDPAVDVDLDDTEVGRNDLIALYEEWKSAHGE